MIKNIIVVKMVEKSVRWAFNFAKWNPSNSDLVLATSCIQPEEKERLARFVFKKDFKASLIGRLMMRQFIHQATRLPYNEIKFARDDKGKPVLQMPSKNLINISFNVSHQGQFAVLAGDVCDVALGVDVMKFEYSGGKTLSEFFRIMNRNFSSSEWSTIKNAGSELMQTSMFCRYWCLKESYVKAIGVGITVNLQDISFKLKTFTLKTNSVVNDTELYVKNEKQNWTFEEMLIDNEHCVAVAAYNNVDCERNSNTLFKEITFSDIVANAVPLLNFDQQYCDNYFKKMEKP